MERQTCPYTSMAPESRSVRVFQILQSPGRLGCRGDCTNQTNFCDFPKIFDVPLTQRAKGSTKLWWRERGLTTEDCGRSRELLRRESCHPLSAALCGLFSLLGMWEIHVSLVSIVWLGNHCQHRCIHWSFLGEGNGVGVKRAPIVERFQII